MPQIRSQIKTFEGPTAPCSLLMGLGLTMEDLAKPRVGVINTWSDINPGHVHLRPVAEAVCEGVKEAGGQPFNFNGLNLCDSIGSGPYVLPSRDLLVNEIEIYAEANKLDAMVLIGTCGRARPADGSRTVRSAYHHSHRRLYEHRKAQWRECGLHRYWHQSHKASGRQDYPGVYG